MSSSQFIKCFNRTVIALIAILFLAPVQGVEKIIRKPIVTDYGIEDSQFTNSINHLLRVPLIGGNKVTELVNGDEFFPEMLDAIRNAKISITFETFIWRSGKISDLFIEALTQKAQAGVAVHCVVDGIGRLELKHKDRNRLKKSGVKFVTFNAVRWYKPWDWNHRTHRKLLVIDGKVGFIGGMCIADEWTGNGTLRDHWRDTQFKVEGPVVGQLQGVFTDNWTRTKSSVLHGKNYFMGLPPQGDLLAQYFQSGPYDGAENARMLYLYSIAAARKSIRIAHAYFVPDNLALDMLLEARKRGVKIEVIAPGVIDHNIVRRAARSRWGKLLEAGVEIYEYQPCKYHNKIMIVDDKWVTCGSINFDDRSFRINDEANLNVFDEDFARRQIRLFDADKAQCNQITLDEYNRRPCHIKFAEAFCALFKSQL